MIIGYIIKKHVKSSFYMSVSLIIKYMNSRNRTMHNQEMKIFTL